MNIDKACMGCFLEKDCDGACKACGFDADAFVKPLFALPLGTIVHGRYITGKPLGVGGFGITYLGFDLVLEIKVAIKEYLPSGVAARGTDGYTMSVLSTREKPAYDAGAKRFLDEARVLAKLKDVPNIVGVQDFFEENGTAYFVMDYCDGESLYSYVARKGGRIPADEALRLLLPVMRALTKVHDHGLLHRDISPDNIFITKDGGARLLDFGAARPTSQENKSMSVILKHGFAPEEQYRTHGEQGPWTDVYAMAATLYNVITGASVPDAMDRLYDDRLIPPVQLGASVSDGANAAIVKALSVRAENRFRTMDEFVSALTGIAAPSATVGIPASAKPNATVQPGATMQPNAAQYDNMTFQPTAATPHADAKDGSISVFGKTINKKLFFGALAGLVAVAALVVILIVTKPKADDSLTAMGGGAAQTNAPVVIPPLGTTPAPTTEPAPTTAPEPTTEPTAEPTTEPTAAPSGDPASAEYGFVLPNPEAFFGVTLESVEAEGYGTVNAFLATDWDMRNYAELIGSVDGATVVYDDAREDLVFSVVDSNGRTMDFMRKKQAVFIVMEENTTIDADEPVITASWLNQNGVTTDGFFALGEKAGLDGWNLLGCSPGNAEVSSYAALQGRRLYIADTKGNIYFVDIDTGNEPELLYKVGFAIDGLMAQADYLFFCDTTKEENFYCMPIDGGKPELLLSGVEDVQVYGGEILFEKDEQLGYFSMQDREEKSLDLPVSNVLNYSVIDTGIYYVDKDFHISYVDFEASKTTKFAEHTTLFDFTYYGGYLYYENEKTHCLEAVNTLDSSVEVLTEPEGKSKGYSWISAWEDGIAFYDNNTETVWYRNQLGKLSEYPAISLHMALLTCEGEKFAVYKDNTEWKIRCERLGEETRQIGE